MTTEKKTPDGSEQGDFAKFVEALKEERARMDREMIRKRTRHGKAAKKALREQQQ